MNRPVIAFLAVAVLLAREAHTAAFFDNAAMQKRITRAVDLIRFLKKKGDESPFTWNPRSQLNRTHCELVLTTPTNDTPLAPEELYTRCRDAVVLVGRAYKCDRCPNMHRDTATGFFINNSGVLVTSYHVVDHENTEGMFILNSDGVGCLAVQSILASSKQEDVALLKVETRGNAFLPLRSGVPIGSPVAAIHHPRGHYYHFNRGTVSSRQIRTTRMGKGRWITVDLEYGEGSSGAPIIDTTGAVVGIVSRTSPLLVPAMVKSANSAKNPENSSIPTTMYAQTVFRFCSPAEAIIDLCRAPPKE